jgi:hypothetical protein
MAKSLPDLRLELAKQMEEQRLQAEIADQWANLKPCTIPREPSPNGGPYQCGNNTCYACNREGYYDKYAPSSGRRCPTPEIDYAEDFGLQSPISIPSPSGTTEVLDWGSEVEEYALTSSKANLSDALTVLDLPI